MLKLFKNTKTLVMLALFVALTILFTRVISVETPFVRISFAFLPIAVSGIMFGPLAAGLAAIIADVLGVFLIGVPPHWGIAFNAFLTGAVYGLLLHKRGHSLPRIAAACAINVGIIAVFLQPFWLSQLIGAPYWPLVISRLPVLAIMFPIQIILIWQTWKRLGKYIERSEAAAS